MNETLIETFPEHKKRGIPMVRGWKYRKNMTVEWGDGSLWDYHEFESALDHDAMYAALKEIWERYKPQSDRRAMYFGGNGVHGCMAVSADCRWAGSHGGSARAFQQGACDASERARVRMTKTEAGENIMTDDQTLEQQDIPTEGTLIAIPVPWAHSPSGGVEWRLVDWTVPDDDGQRLPIWADVAGDTGAWGSDYALRGPQDGEWGFPDGERCSVEALAAAFRRRRIKH
jgi:hypothetical protein